MSLQPADRAWLAGAAAIAAWDIIGSETLSAAMLRYKQRWPVAIPAVIIYLAAHLLGYVPERVDPLHLIFGWRTR